MPCPSCRALKSARATKPCCISTLSACNKNYATRAPAQRRYARRIRIDTRIDPRLRALAHRLPFEWQGFVWLSINIRVELANLVMMLHRSRSKWLEPGEWRKLHQHLTRQHQQLDIAEKPPAVEAPPQ